AEADVAGCLEVRQPLETERDDLPGKRGAVSLTQRLARHDARHHFIPPHVIGDRRDTHGSDPGMLQQYALDLHRGDVLAAAANDVLLPVDEVEIPLGIDVNDIPRMKVAARPRGRRCRLVLEILTEKAEARRITRMS